MLLYIGGYLSVTAMTFLTYLRHMSMQDILFSQLNPLNLIWNRLMHLFGWLPEEYSIVDNAGFRVLDQDMTYTLNSWYHAVVFSLFVLIGAGVVLVGKRLEKGSRQNRAKLLLVCWIGFAFPGEAATPAA